MPKCPSLVQMIALTNSVNMQNINVLGNVVIDITICLCTRTLTAPATPTRHWHLCAYFCV